MTPKTTIDAIQARSVPLAGVMIDHDAQDDSYFAGYLAGYVHASDRAIELVRQITCADMAQEIIRQK